MPPQLTELLSALGISGSRELCDRILDEAGGPACLHSSRDLATRMFDASNAAVDEIQGWLRDRLDGFADNVDVAWVANRTGAPVPAQVFVNHVDDLWYPAMDDVVVLARGDDSTAVILLDHEERLEFWMF